MVERRPSGRRTRVKTGARSGRRSTMSVEGAAPSKGDCAKTPAASLVLNPQSSILNPQFSIQVYRALLLRFFAGIFSGTAASAAA